MKSMMSQLGRFFFLSAWRRFLEKEEEKKLSRHISQESDYRNPYISDEAYLRPSAEAGEFEWQAAQSHFQWMV